MGLIRMLLALSVVFAHTHTPQGMGMAGGQLAVQGFFMISGFYMALILTEKYTGAGAISIFWRNRALKIFPAYWLVLGLTIVYAICQFCIATQPPAAVLGRYTNPLIVLTDGKTLLSAAEIIYIAFTQCVIFLIDSLVFLKPTGHFFAFTSNFLDDATPLWPLLFVPPAWSLSLELMFYALAPLLIATRLRWLAVLMLASVALRYSIYFGLGWRNDPWSYRFFPTELAFFLAGFIGYKLLGLVEAHLDRLTIKRLGLLLFTANVALIVLFGVLPIPGKTYMFVWLFGISVPFIFVASKNWSADRMIGDLSYPVYIVHFLVILVARDAAPALSASPNYGFIIAILSIAAGYAINALLMYPLEAVRNANKARLQEAPI